MEQTPATTRPKTPARRHARLFATVAVSTLAAIAVFSVFYVIGAVVGLAMLAAAGVVMIAGLAWLSFKAGRRRAPARAATATPAP